MFNILILLLALLAVLRILLGGSGPNCIYSVYLTSLALSTLSMALYIITGDARLLSLFFFILFVGSVELIVILYHKV